MTIGEQIIRKLGQYKGFDEWWWSRIEPRWSRIEPRYQEQIMNELGRFVVLRVEDTIEQALTTLTTTKEQTTMSETTTTAESATGAAPGTGGPANPAPATDNFDTPGVSTHSDPWAIEAAALPNKDVHVAVTDPLFDKQSCLATVLAPEKDGDKGLAVKLGFRLEEEIVSEEGIRKVPGTTWKPRFSSILVAAGPGLKDQEQAERGRRDVARLAQAVKVLPKGDPTLGELVAAVGKLEGKKVRINFTVTKGSKRDTEAPLDSSGQHPFVKFQNVRFAAPESAGNGAGGAGVAASNDDY